MEQEIAAGCVIEKAYFGSSNRVNEMPTNRLFCLVRKIRRCDLLLVSRVYCA